MTYQDLYKVFLTSSDTLRIYREEKLVFSSQKDRLLPLMEYIKEQHHTGLQSVTIFDRIMGNAAACLAVKANGKEVYSPLGSELGIKTLKQHNIIYHLDKIVPYIIRDDGKDMCPMEKLSMDKKPEEFYQDMKKRVEGNK
jgi:hypothetical protein